MQAMYGNAYVSKSMVKDCSRGLLHIANTINKYAPLKCWSSTMRLHGAISQKALIFTINKVQHMLEGTAASNVVRIFPHDLHIFEPLK
jgi:hypothetical protein